MLLNLFIRLREKTAFAVKNRSDFCRIGLAVIKESPVPVMAVKIAEQCIHDKYIPEVFKQFFGVYEPLLFDGFQNVRQFCSAATMFRVDYSVFNRATV